MAPHRLPNCRLTALREFRNKEWQDSLAPSARHLGRCTPKFAVIPDEHRGVPLLCHVGSFKSDASLLFARSA